MPALSGRRDRVGDLSTRDWSSVGSLGGSLAAWSHQLLDALRSARLSRRSSRPTSRRRQNRPCPSRRGPTLSGSFVHRAIRSESCDRRVLGKRTTLCNFFPARFQGKRLCCGRLADALLVLDSWRESSRNLAISPETDARARPLRLPSRPEGCENSLYAADPRRTAPAAAPRRNMEARGGRQPAIRRRPNESTSTSRRRFV